MFKKKQNSTKSSGFTLVELIVVVAMMIALTGVFAPALIKYVEESRADKDSAHMQELVDAVELAMTDQKVYEDLLACALESNFSCYSDGTASNVDTNKVLVYNAGDDETVVEPIDWWMYNDNARQANEIAYAPDGNMSGVTITFAHSQEPGEQNKISLEYALINNMSPTTKKPNSTLVEEFSTDGTPYLYQKLKELIKDDIVTESQRYRNSEYTIFIRMLPANADYKKYANITVDVYGQWSGKNIKSAARRDPTLEVPGIDAVVPTPPDAIEHDSIIPNAPGVDRTPQIPRDPAVFVPPEALDVTYNGQFQPLISPGTTEHGSMYYKLGDGQWSMAIPNAIDSGDYVIKYYVKGDAYHYDSEEGELMVTVKKATPVLVAPQPIAGLMENGSSQTLITSGSVTGGTLYYKIEGEAYSTTVPSATVPGVYPISYKVVGNPHYIDLPEVTIMGQIKGQAAATKEPEPKTGLVYNGNEQTLITTGQTYGGYFMYKINNGSYSTTVPKATAAGTYTISYYIKGLDSNYVDSEVKSFTVEISKGTPRITAPSSVTVEYNGAAQALAKPGLTNGGTLKYSLDNSNWSTNIPTGTNAGNYTVYYKVEGDSNWNSVSADAPLNSKITKAAPTYTILGIDGEYTGNNQTLIATATCNSGGAIYYKMGTASWSTTKPSAKDPNTYTISFYIAETSNYLGVSEKTITAKINKGNAPDSAKPVITGATWTYDGNERKVSCTPKDWTVTFSKNETTGYSSELLGTANAGTTKIYWKATHPKYKDLKGSVDLVCNKATLTVTTTNGTATYNGRPQTGGATLNYSCATAPLNGITVRWGLSSGNYTMTSMPSFTDAGTSVAYFQITSPNFNTYAGSLTVTIGKADNDFRLGTNTGAVLVGKSATTTIISNPSGATPTISVRNTSVATASLSGNTLTFTGVAKGATHIDLSVPETKNYKAATISYPVTVSTTILTIDLGGGTISGSSDDLTYGLNEGAKQEQSFSYDANKKVQTFTPLYTGFYYIEAWGAAGGKDATRGGYGGYLKGYVYLMEGQTIYIALGGKGGDNLVMSQTPANAVGGWNGGARPGSGNSTGYSGAGGGCTSIYTNLRGDGQLSNYANYKNEVIMVAGGGAGGSANSAGMGGTVLYAYSENNSSFPGEVINNASTSLLVANQFAIGKNPGSSDGGGGGGGWVGGKNGLDAAGNSAGGGASFVNTLLKCIPVELTPDTNTGNGKVKITYESYSVGLETPVREGYRFTGWVLQGGGSISTNALGGTTMFNFTDGEAKLVATWEKI